MKGILIATLVISMIAVIAFATLIVMRLYGKNKASTDAPQQQTPSDKDNQPTPSDKDNQPTPPENAEQAEGSQ